MVNFLHLGFARGRALELIHRQQPLTPGLLAPRQSRGRSKCSGPGGMGYDQK
jgi:hypothetical protein